MAERTPEENPLTEALRKIGDPEQRVKDLEAELERRIAVMRERAERAELEAASWHGSFDGLAARERELVDVVAEHERVRREVAEELSMNAMFAHKELADWLEGLADRLVSSGGEETG